MSEKSKEKVTVEDLLMMPIPPATLVDEGYGAFSFKYPDSVDIVTQMEFVCAKYNQIAKDKAMHERIIPLDFMVKVATNKTTNKITKVLIIKKSGKIKIAQMFGFKSSIPKILEKTKDYALVQSQVFFEDNDNPYTDIGYCGRDEKGHDAWDFATILGTAITRSVLRAIGQRVIVDMMDEAEYEQIAQNVENQIDAEMERKAEKKAAEAAVMIDLNKTQAEESILQSKEIAAQRKFGNTKQTKKANKTQTLVNGILHSDQPVNNTDPDADRDMPEDI
ncbi:MAG: hypothetical protein WC648_05175 [Candidatus Paceibacterota bacterium]|jgi:hypothetical protein